MGKLADRAQQYLERMRHSSESYSPTRSLPDGVRVRVTQNDGLTRTGIIRGAIWQESGTACQPGWWYWVESDSLTHESRLSVSEAK